MKSRVAFITYDLSGYYPQFEQELKAKGYEVDYFNLANYSYSYKNFGERLKAFLFKITKGGKLKNYYKYQPIIKEISRHQYDSIIVVRPDLFFDSQLEVLKNHSKNLIAYYHDSINNIRRKKEVIPFFDKVFSYERKDVDEHQLIPISNFIYQDFPMPASSQNIPKTAFTVMGNDFRVKTLIKLAQLLHQKDIKTDFYVYNHRSKKLENPNFTTIHQRMPNSEVVKNIENHDILVDIHKYGVQDGLTFRVFESLYYSKKLITTNHKIKNYPFYNPLNIAIIDAENIEISDDFFNTPYQKVEETILKSYHYKTWLDTLLND